MSIEKILLDEAARMADSLEGGVVTLELELVAIEQRRIETEAELKTAKLARTRLLDFGHAWGTVTNAPTAGFKTKRNRRSAPWPA